MEALSQHQDLYKRRLLTDSLALRLNAAVAP
jgi:hypothetical protein